MPKSKPKTGEISGSGKVEKTAESKKQPVYEDIKVASLIVNAMTKMLSITRMSAKSEKKSLFSMIR